MQKKIFSDSWHQVADLQLRLLHDIKIFKQFYRGQKWYVLEDSYNNRFFRITPEAYRFLMRLNSEKPIGQIWQESLQNNPEDTPTQNELIELLTQLHTSNLLLFKNRANADAMFDRVKTRETKEMRAKLAYFLYLRIPLWNPEKLLKKSKPLIDLVFNINGFFIWLVFGCFALKAVVENIDQVSRQTQGILAPGNLLYLYGCLVFLKVCHEFGHAMMAKRFGGSVSTMGVMLLIFTPIPYMDATTSWSFRSKYQRMLVGAAGMMVELFIAFIATLVWANTGGGLLHSLAFNVMLIGSVSSMIFNGNPLLKYDAYYILSDFLEIPNLYERSVKYWRDLGERYLFDSHSRSAPRETASAGAWLIVYSLLSAAYRVLVSTSIVLFVADKWFLLGCVTAAIFMYTWFLKPLYGCLKYLMTDPQLRSRRRRAVSLSALIVATLIAGVGFIPFYHSIRATGVIKSMQATTLYSPMGGLLTDVYAKDGQQVEAGDLIARIENYDIELNIEKHENQLEEVRALLVQARQGHISALKPLQKKIETIIEKIAILKTKQSTEVIKAPHAGIFVSRDLKLKTHTWIGERDVLGRVINGDSYKFIAVVTQSQAYDLFHSEHLAADIRLPGMAGIRVDTEALKVIPYEQDTLPAVSLGWKAGGEIPTRDDDPSGKLTRESFFMVTTVMKKPSGVYIPLFYHDKRGEMRIDLSSAPIGSQLYKKFEQLLQKRYSL